MAGSLIKIQETTVSSATASVSLVGIDSTYDVYKVVISKCVPVTDTTFLSLRATESGTPNTTSNYDGAGKLLRSNTTFNNSSDTNATSLFLLGDNTGTGTGEQLNLVNYIFNANNSSEFTFFTTENTFLNNSATLKGLQGGGVFTVASSVDGVQYFFSSGNIASATFVLYGLKK